MTRCERERAYEHFQAVEALKRCPAPGVTVPCPEYSAHDLEVAGARERQLIAEAERCAARSFLDWKKNGG